jgi:hypothetical protein
VTRVPRAHIYLDTEARRDCGPRVERQTFRLAVAAYDAKRHKGDGWQARRWHHATDTAALWGWITACCRAKARTVLVAHNLAYDLRISNAFEHLPALGWTFKAGRVDDGQAWFIFARDGRTLAMVDSVSWCPVPLERLGELVGVPKRPLPDDDDDNDVWFDRCARDVEILAEVWRRLMAWVTDDDLGNWKLSGAGQSWAAFRHRFMSHNLLVHEDDDARAAERAAALTGRCEAWRYGQLRGGPFTEYDFTTAYARIGRDCDVPVKLAGELRSPTLDRVLTAAAARAVLAEVTVTTDVPVLATRTDNGICWPVGTFRTVAWSNELDVALGEGARVTVERAWVYRTAPALRDFCAWVLDGLDGARGPVDPVVRVALKHWSRALIGRTAAQWSRWERWGESAVSSVGLSRAHDVGAGDRFALLQLGTQLLRQSAAPENPDAMVAVMSWVMAESRVRLWRAMSAAGFEHVVYCDTDSLIVTPAGSGRLVAAAIPGLRVKGEWRSLRVLGPRQLVPGLQLRAAGVPRNAVQVAPDTWEAPVWSGLARSLTTGQADTVEIARRRFAVRGTDNRRVHVANGRTVPRRLDLPAVVAAS